ncbi:MAG: DinB family protein [Planctomycetes bacterium]|nr:DinB family protein [Planctomycetota bacterium]
MQPMAIAEQLKAAKEFFARSTRVLSEEHAEFRPREGMFSVAELIAHTAQTVDWFFEGAFRPECFDMDFETLHREIAKVKTLAEARAWLDRAFEKAIGIAGSKSEADWAALLPPNMIMGEAPRWVIVGALADHTAHHRGALTVYSRLLGLVPPLPYMDM